MRCISKGVTHQMKWRICFRTTNKWGNLKRWVYSQQKGSEKGWGPLLKKPTKGITEIFADELQNNHMLRGLNVDARVW